MKTSIAALVAGYLFSQFYRAFLAVLAPMLNADTGAGAQDLALSSGLWFLTFAVMQLPVGWALDRFGPRRTAAWLLGGAGGAGALVLAQAGSALEIHAAMVLIGIGCSPVLMAAYYIYARMFPVAVFATLAGATLGFGSLGNILGAWPLAWAAETFGWRGTMAVLGAMTALVGLTIGRVVQDPPPVSAGPDGRGSLLDILRMPAIWLLLPLLIVNYAPSAGLRSLWVGPYYTDVFGATTTGVGQVTLVMALAMVAGNFAYGPMDRIFGTRKWVVLGGNLLGASCLLILWAMPVPGFWQAGLMLAAIGFFGASFPLIMAHGRSFIPPHLLGRGVALLNLFVIGGAGMFQLLSAPVHSGAPQLPPQAPYQAVFLFFGLILLAGCAVYAFSRDRTD